jgi:hypothetical protein
LREQEVPLVLPSEFPDNIHGPLKMRTPSRHASGSDDYRNSGGQRLPKHDAKISLYTLAWTAWFAGAQVIRPRIRAARVTTYKISALLYRANQTFFAKTGTEIPRGGNGSYFFQSIFLSLALLLGCISREVRSLLIRVAMRTYSGSNLVVYRIESLSKI